MRKNSGYERRKWLSLILVGCVIMTSVPVSGAPQLLPYDALADDQAEKERWLADESFYDFEYELEKPQADGSFVPSNDLCPPVPKTLYAGGCDVEECSSDRECVGRQLKCCYNGCVYTCLPEVRPPPYFDWRREPRRRLQFGLFWLVPGRGTSRDVEMCSTSPVDDDSDPLVCPHGYECSIDDAGSPDKGIPNKGHCVRVQDHTEETYDALIGAARRRTSKSNDVKKKTETATSHACDVGDHMLLLEGHSLTVDGKLCVCNDKKLVCDSS